MCHKVYVDVQAQFTADGRVTPQMITWTDDRIYEVDRILNVRKAASRKVGGHGILYTVRICGKETNLFREDDRWFVEAKDREGAVSCADDMM